MNILIKRLLITRPYSWIGIILIGLLSNIAITKRFILGGDLFWDIFTALIIWYVAIFLGEYLHRKIDKRGLTRPTIPLIFSVMLALILFYKNMAALIFLPIIILADTVYSMKIKNWILSRFSFMFRGILEVSIFLIIAFFHNNYAIYKFIPLLLIIYLLTNSRNLIGDIRDLKFDRYTFPNRYGVDVSYLVSLGFIIMSILLSPNLLVAFPIISIMLLIFLYRNAYILHKIFVISAAFFYMNYIFFILDENLILVNILFLATLLNFTYDLVPRKSNPKKKIYRYQK